MKDGQTILISWDPLFAGLNKHRNIDYTYLLNKLHLRISHHAQLIRYSHTKVQFHTSTHSEDIGLSVILQSDWSIASKVITQDILSVMKFEM